MGRGKNGCGPTLEEIMCAVRINGPEAVRNLQTRLALSETELMVSELKLEGMLIEVYDIPFTMGIWMEPEDGNVNYAHMATDRFVEVLAEREGIDNPFEVEGFKRLLPHFTADNFYTLQIPPWGTRLSSMLANVYDCSPAAAILDLVANDPKYVKIREANLQRYDFSIRPKKTWSDPKGDPTGTARAATKQFIMSLAKTLGVEDCTSVKGFKKILPYVSIETFSSTEINVWGTKLNALLDCAYGCSPSAAVLDMINHDAEFAAIKKAGLCSYDFQRSPLHTWLDENGNSTDLSRRMIGLFVDTVAAEQGIDNYAEIEGFQRLMPFLLASSMETKPVNVFGTTACTPFANAYQSSPGNAILDLIENDYRFERLRGQVTQDMFSRSAKATISWNNGRRTAAKAVSQ